MTYNVSTKLFIFLPIKIIDWIGFSLSHIVKKTTTTTEIPYTKTIAWWGVIMKVNGIFNNPMDFCFVSFFSLLYFLVQDGLLCAINVWSNGRIEFKKRRLWDEESVTSKKLTGKRIPIQHSNIITRVNKTINLNEYKMISIRKNKFYWILVTFFLSMLVKQYKKIEWTPNFQIENKLYGLNGAAFDHHFIWGNFDRTTHWWLPMFN